MISVPFLILLSVIGLVFILFVFSGIYLLLSQRNRKSITEYQLVPQEEKEVPPIKRMSSSSLEKGSQGPGAERSVLKKSFLSRMSEKLGSATTKSSSEDSLKDIGRNKLLSFPTRATDAIFSERSSSGDDDDKREFPGAPENISHVDIRQSNSQISSSTPEDVETFPKVLFTPQSSAPFERERSANHRSYGPDPYRSCEKADCRFEPRTDHGRHHPKENITIPAGNKMSNGDLEQRKVSNKSNYLDDGTKQRVVPPYRSTDSSSRDAERSSSAVHTSSRNPFSKSLQNLLKKSAGNYLPGHNGSLRTKLRGRTPTWYDAETKTRMFSKRTK